MLNNIRHWINTNDFLSDNLLSIDDNPLLDKMLLQKNPAAKISKAVYPHIDAQNLYKINNEAFDVVYSHQVLEHIPKPWIAAKEMTRVLKKGGIGIHTTCAFNPRHGPPVFNDYYRFLPDGLEQLFDGVKVLVKNEWGNREALIYNLAINDGHGDLGGRRFNKVIGERKDGLYPWVTWIIFQKI